MLSPLPWKKWRFAGRNRALAWIGPWALLANLASGVSDPEIGALQKLLEQGHVAEAERRAAQFLSSPRLGSRADSIGVLVATRVIVAAGLQQPGYDEPTMSSHVESLLALSEAVFGPHGAWLADAHQYAGLLERSRGDFDAAVDHFRAAIRILDSNDSPNQAERARAFQNIAETYFHRGRYVEAMREFERELEARESLNSDNIDIGTTLVNLNEARKAAFDTVGIATAYHRARRIFERHEGSDSPRMADALHRDGVWRLGRGDLEGAGRALDWAIAIRERTAGQETLLAESLHERARVHLAIGESDSAIVEGSRARILFAVASGPVDPAVASCLMTIAHAQRADFRNDEALATYLEALRTYEASVQPDSAGISNCLRTLASHSLDQALYADARRYAQRALQTSRRVWGARSSETAITRLAYAATLQSSQQPDSARVHYELARRDLRAILGETHPLLAEPILRLATLAREQGDLAQARAGAERALALLDRAYGPKDPRLTDAYHELGIVKRLLGDPIGSRSELVRALELISRKDRESESKAAILSSLALLERSLGNEASAVIHLQEALGITGRVRGQEHPRYALILRTLASLANAGGRFTEARGLYESALKILEPTLGREHHDVAATRLGLGNALKVLGERVQARKQYEQAVEIHRVGLGPEAPALALDYHNLAVLSLEEGDLQAAMEKAEEAERLSRQHFKLIARGVSEREALHFGANRVRGIDIVLTAAGRSESRSAWEKAWDLVIRSRAAVLEEMAARRRFSMTTQEPEVVALWDRLTRASNHLAHLAVRGRSETESLTEFKTRLAEARLEKEAAERALAARSTDFSKRAEQEETGLQDVLQKLPQRSVLIAWVHYERLEQFTSSQDPRSEGGQMFYAAFVVDSAQRDVRLVQLGPATVVEALVSQWREQAGRNPKKEYSHEVAEQDYVRVGLDLRRLVWDPVSSGVDHADRVFLVPDAALCLVNFDALPNDAGGFLVEDAPHLLTLASERGLNSTDGSGAVGDGLLIVGNPEYSISLPVAEGTPNRSLDRGIPCGQFKALVFEPLPGAAREAEAIVQLWRANGKGAVHQLRGANASEREFRRLAAGRRILHLATHGFFLGAECAAGPPHRSAAARDELTIGSLVAESPLLLSGLAFAGANQREKADSSSDDGILTAEEIAALDFSGVDVAVLSACGTGLGQVKAGEGVIGLRRAFQVAGVNSLIMSLWSVEDDATAEWMQRLFEASLNEGQAAAEAVREATLQVLRERRRQGTTVHPFYWGAFIATAG